MRSFSQLWKGTLAYATILLREKSGRSIFTTQTEAERRAAICVTCPKNEQVDKGKIDKAEDELVAKRLEGRTTPVDAKLHTCTACTCQITTIVHMMPDILLAGARAKFFRDHPAHCWKHQFIKRP